MNSLKPLAMIAILGGIGYAVYTRIHGDGDTTPPPGAENPWQAPSVQMPGEASAPGTPWTPGAQLGSATPFAPPSASIGATPQNFTQPVQPGMTPNQPGAPPAGAVATPPPTTWPPAAVPPGGSTLGPPVGTNSPPAGTNPPTTGTLPFAGSDPRTPFTPPTTPQFPGAPTGIEAGSPGAAAVLPPGETLGSALEVARRQLDQGLLAEGLRQLSIWYDDPRTSLAEQEQLIALLDQVAGTVVYSTQHLLEPPYEVQTGERLDEIAHRHNIPWQLLAKINGLDGSQELRPGEVLKVVRGPFSAVVNLDKRRLTLLLNGSYAGRFAIGLGRDYPLRDGQYAVVEKVANPTYHGLDRAIEADDPSNPLGERWIGLGSQLGIHGTNDPNAIGPMGQTGMPGCVNLSPRDVEDVYDILTIGSKIIVRR